MSYSITDHHLCGSQVRRVGCPGKTTGVFTPGLPDTLVIHFTAGSSLDSAVTHLTSPEVRASAHMVIGRNGEVVQMIGFDQIAWHAGDSYWNGREKLNRYSIGIELDNAGRLNRAGTSFISWSGRKYPEDQAIQAVHRNESTPTFWHIYPEPQIEVCFAVCRCLAGSYPIKTIVGHEEISPGRKVDPGPAFPLDRLRDQILCGRNDPRAQAASMVGEPKNQWAEVSANLLNFRELPHPEARLAGEPLRLGTRVEILERSGEWCRVSVSRKGWVHGSHLKRNYT